MYQSSIVNFKAFQKVPLSLDIRKFGMFNDLGHYLHWTFEVHRNDPVLADVRRQGPLEKP